VSNWRASVLVVCGVACASQHAARPDFAAGAVRVDPEPQSAGPVYRFVPSSSLGRGAQQVDAEHIAGLEPVGDARMVVARDGSMERALTPDGESLMGGVPVPEHLGRGFLFWTRSGLYRTQTFTGALEPIARVHTNVIGVEFGPTSLLLFTPDGPPRAYALDSGRRVPLSPHGVLEIAAADAERSLAFDAAGRALATVDGGRSWKDVTARLGDTAHGLKQEAREVGFVLGQDVVAWLQKDGGFVRRPATDAGGKRPGNDVFEPLSRAMLVGLPLSNAHALTVGEGIEDVDLASGQARTLTDKLPFGSSCLPLSAEEKAILICFSYGQPRDSLAVVSGALGEHPRVEKVFELTQPYTSPSYAMGDAVLVVGKSCAGLPVDGVACARSPARADSGQPAAWAEVDIRATLGTTWEVLYWVPKAKGGVAALAMERTLSGSSRKLALIDAATGAVTPFDAPLEHVAPQGFTRTPERSFVVLDNGTLRGFTRTSGLSVDAKGHVSPSTQTFKNVESAGASALAQDEADRLWQTTDYGEHWAEVAPPPFEPQLPPVPADSFRREHGRAITCSLVGCVLEHESGLGNWLRLGWPVDPPRAKQVSPGSDPAKREPVPPLRPPAPAPGAAKPKLRCVASSAPVPPGRPLLTPGTGRTAARIEYGDIFSHEPLITYGLRGFVRVSRAGKAELDRAFASLAATKSPFEVELAQPFDPALPSLRAKGSLAAWSLLLKDRAPSPGGDQLRVDLSRGSARPVLSAEPGRADGVLLVDDDFSFAVTHTGIVHPIRPGCRADSGYADARGTLFVTCGDSSGATALGDADHHRLLLRLPLADRFRDDSGAGMRFFEPGRQLLTNPDAVAVGPHGKLAIVRTASGSEPATVDTPAWLLSADGPPVELAPWATLEPATSPACAKGGGYRALVQTGTPWLDVEGARFSGNAPGMSAIVRWSPERVCLEAVEIGLREQAGGSPAKTDPGLNGAPPITVMIVARFTANDASAAFVGTSTTASVREPAKCELVPP
jgi:photosystem II stability/assembly factor-like uncharacterized protein